ncbi:hypothetical protein ACIPCF_07730 [Paracoccus marcusii]|uniref:hypothetical protein n=1 Tax=Paracoccus marcusii TaxID=59779 RepID=UPI0038B9E2D8
MAKKTDQTEAAPAADVKEQTVATSADQAPATAADTAVQVDAPADPAPATELDNPSGAIIEPEILGAVDVGHESVDANPRAGTTSVQNAVDWNDAKRANPQDDDFAGQGLDTSVYGKGTSA